MERASALAAEEGPLSGPAPDAGAAFGVVERLSEGPGWTLDVSRPRKPGDVVGGDAASGAAPERVE
jgi:hypothetical protein